MSSGQRCAVAAGSPAAIITSAGPSANQALPARQRRASATGARRRTTSGRCESTRAAMTASGTIARRQEEQHRDEEELRRDRVAAPTSNWTRTATAYASVRSTSVVGWSSRDGRQRDGERDGRRQRAGRRCSQRTVRDARCDTSRRRARGPRRASSPRRDREARSRGHVGHRSARQVRVDVDAVDRPRLAGRHALRREDERHGRVAAGGDRRHEVRADEDGSRRLPARPVRAQLRERDRRRAAEDALVDEADLQVARAARAVVDEEADRRVDEADAHLRRRRLRSRRQHERRGARRPRIVVGRERRPGELPVRRVGEIALRRESSSSSRSNHGRNTRDAAGYVQLPSPERMSWTCVTAPSPIAGGPAHAPRAAVSANTATAAARNALEDRDRNTPPLRRSSRMTTSPPCALIKHGRGPRLIP